MQYVAHIFIKTFITTIGIDFRIKMLKVDSQYVKLQVLLPPLLRSIDLGHCRSGTFSYPHLLLLPRLPGHHDRVRDQRPLLLQQHHQLDRANQACMHKVLMSTNSMPTRMSPSCWWETRVTWRPIGYVVDALYEEQVVSYEEGELLAKQYNIPFLETSAENGKNIDLVRPRPPMASLGL